MTVRLAQIKAFLLLAVFLAAGTSLPSLDALVYHGVDVETERRQTHVESAGDCPDHSGHCALARTAPGSGAVAALAGRIRIQSHERFTLQRPASRVHPEIARTGIPRPRAPPAPLV